MLKMLDHNEACDGSKDLCDRLFECVSTRIPNLLQLKTKTTCALYQSGRTKFAYIRHRKRISRIEIRCLGDTIMLQKSTSLNVKPVGEKRGNLGGGFQARFFVDQPSEINSACNLLYQVSYGLSKRK